MSVLNHVTTTHRGLTITEHTRSRLVCRFQINELRRAARDLPHAHAIIDAALAAQAQPGARIVAFTTGRNTVKSPGRYRDAQDRAHAMRGKAGRFQATK